MRAAAYMRQGHRKALVYGQKSTSVRTTGNGSFHVGLLIGQIIDASDKTTFEHLRAQRDRQRSQSVALDDDPGDARRSPSPPADTSPTREETPAPEKGEKFKLVIRAGTAKDITIAVRPTTTCGVIVRAFVKAAGLNVPAAKLAAARIIVDGDKMDNDTEIGEADLEDGDMVEIAGL
jgi:hypothetical protein